MYESAIIAILRVTECGFRGKTDIAISERHAPFEPKRTLSGQICCAAKHSDVAVCYDTVVSPSAACRLFTRFGNMPRRDAR
jgi:hypothetical protein